MKGLWLALLLIGTISIVDAQTNIQNAARYRSGQFDGTYIHGVDNSGNPAQSGDASYREMPSGITNGVYSWWNNVACWSTLRFLWSCYRFWEWTVRIS